MARADFDQLLKDRTQVRRGYPLLWLTLALRRGGAAPLSTQAVSWAVRDLPTEWPRPLVDWALGGVGDDALIKAAKDSKTPRERLCEAYFYIGEKLSAEGDTTRASEYFRKAVDQGVLEFVEYGLARHRLGLKGS